MVAGARLSPPRLPKESARTSRILLGSLVVVPALIHALNDWITTGKEPPKSCYGSVRQHTLVPSNRTEHRLPENPRRDLHRPVQFPAGYRLQRATTRRRSRVWCLGSECDRDGNSLAGIRLPPLQVPIATYTAWNLRAAGHAEGECCSTSGSYIPFAKTKAERLANGDPRLSIEERYRSHAITCGEYKGCAQVGEGRLLLPADADHFIKQANSEAIKKLFPN